jgi:hypothetical protein
MSDTHLVELEIDDRRFEALEAEASRLGLEIPQLVMRAASAWLVDMTEGTVTVSGTATVVAQ